MSHRRASTTSSISSFFDPSREIDSFASPVRGGMLFSESPSSSSRPPTSSSSTSARPPTAKVAKPAPTSSLTSSLNNASNNNNKVSSQPVAMATTATAATATAAVPIPAPSSDHSRNSSLSAGVAIPLSVSIPRQRSFSSSFSLATSGVPISAGAPSPRTFTGSSMISNPGSFPGAANPFTLGAFAPLSPTSSSPPGNGGSNSVSASQSVPVLHRRFSSSFNQLNQIVSPPARSTERGRRTSMFGGSSPPTTISIQTAGNTATNNNTDTHNSVSAMGSGLFRKFSTSRPMTTTSNTASIPSSGAAAGHPFDRNDAGPTVVVSPQPSNNQQQHSSMLSPPGTQEDARHLTTAVDKLKPSYDKTSRSSSPMRNMILNGQMLD
ncbi:hypothetical protein EC957_003996 [Mortierella hygrophila]|uniref:Uncharacterized protein n=1 Tax=Mortierella hygrophila TaxID=979708 RepID=A0A9P6K0L3_9FUNG|nr:hypothetical protein EC957_003996 [Mortierella hygrophila]